VKHILLGELGVGEEGVLPEALAPQNTTHTSIITKSKTK